MGLKNKIIIGLGSSLEWFDFALYGFFGSVFSKIFFSPAMQIHWLSFIITYAIFAVGFAARPIGALIFGYIGDKYGRIIPLRTTPLLITLTTLFIAVLPTYKTIGNTAVLLLVATRIIQGILLGGEFAGNIVYLCESSTKRRYFWGSIGSCTASFGIILASTIASTLNNLFSHDFIYNYGWRLAFLLSLPIGLIVFLNRLRLSESPEFHHNINRKRNNPIIESLKNHKKTLFVCLGLIYLHATSFYFVFLFIPIFLNKIRHLKESASLLNNTEFLITHLLLIPLFGLIVNRINSFTFLINTALGFILLSIPLFYFIAYGNQNEILISLLFLSIMTAVNAAIIPGLFSEIIPNNVRYTILALVFNIGFGIFGGITPFLSLLLINKTGSIMSPSIYLTISATITFTACWIIKIEESHEIREI